MVIIIEQDWKKEPKGWIRFKRGNKIIWIQPPSEFAWVSKAERAVPFLRQAGKIKKNESVYSKGYGMKLKKVI